MPGKPSPCWDRSLSGSGGRPPLRLGHLIGQSDQLLIGKRRPQLREQSVLFGREVGPQLERKRPSSFLETGARRLESTHLGHELVDLGLLGEPAPGRVFGLGSGGHERGIDDGLLGGLVGRHTAGDLDEQPVELIRVPGFVQLIEQRRHLEVVLAEEVNDIGRHALDSRAPRKLQPMSPWFQRRRHDHAVSAWHTADEGWQVEQNALTGMLDVAKTFRGLTRAEQPDLTLELHRDEHLFYAFDGAQLIEPHRLPGHWQSGYSGFSFRVARGVRWHVGGTRGHYVSGAEVPTPMDTGTASITDQRVVFQGGRQSREWLFAKLLGYQHATDAPWTALQVSNRGKVSGVLYDREHAEQFHFRLALALAHYHQDLPGFLAHLTDQLAEHARLRPAPPPPLRAEQ
jgi:hypothetical protein